MYSKLQKNDLIFLNPDNIHLGTTEVYIEYLTDEPDNYSVVLESDFVNNIYTVTVEEN